MTVGNEAYPEGGDIPKVAISYSIFVDPKFSMRFRVDGSLRASSKW